MAILFGVLRSGLCRWLYGCAPVRIDAYGDVMNRKSRLVTVTACCALVMSCLVSPTPVFALQDVPTTEGGPWTLSGKSEMRWLGFKLYDAELWMQGPNFDPSAGFALALTYARDIERTR